MSEVLANCSSSSRSLGSSGCGVAVETELMDPLLQCGFQYLAGSVEPGLVAAGTERVTVEDDPASEPTAAAATTAGCPAHQKHI
ncbi:hypothetical protein DNTS_016459 [Danionella cerebrum]|uniref:Uncharacterized protein n=1 Tax=Danionella cerebrum TaxID=2873325 RepID=A0A553R208_9TELE|nr:hypothetical protein DNTS_016459 [Danionella translucida]